MTEILKSFETLAFVREISPDDWMGKGVEPVRYYRRGYSALSLIVEACARTNLSPRRILDFGCGHGNVARMLVAQYPDAQVTGQDVDASWLAWCESSLGIQTVQSAPRIADVQVAPGAFDLIWVGSVFTHIPPDGSKHLLGALSRGLVPGGLLIFTTAGQAVRNNFRPGHEPFLDRGEAEQALVGFDEVGYGYAGYKGGRYEDWGRSLITVAWMRNLIREQGLNLLSVQEQGWGGRQDVYCVTDS